MLANSNFTDHKFETEVFIMQRLLKMMVFLIVIVMVIQPVFASISVKDLGTFPAKNIRFAVATGINNNGQIADDSINATGYYHAFSWQNGVMTDLGTLGGIGSGAYGINNNGQIVGESQNATGSYHAFLWQSDVMTDLGTLPGGTVSGAFGINNNGQIAGYSQNASKEVHAALWTVTSLTITKSANLSEAW